MSSSATRVLAIDVVVVHSIRCGLFGLGLLRPGGLVALSNGGCLAAIAGGTGRRLLRSITASTDILLRRLVWRQIRIGDDLPEQIQLRHGSRKTYTTALVDPQSEHWNKIAKRNHRTTSRDMTAMMAPESSPHNACGER